MIESVLMAGQLLLIKQYISQVFTSFCPSSVHIINIGNSPIYRHMNHFVFIQYSGKDRMIPMSTCASCWKTSKGKKAQSRKNSKRITFLEK